mmetsp:Transcript_21222/g.46304  ORF Transcript_21222/g.46304 Transcript_21222/m.46304 type:complete len:267 (+) Transcript_21222:412-1212(+)
MKCVAHNDPMLLKSHASVEDFQNYLLGFTSMLKNALDRSNAAKQEKKEEKILARSSSFSMTQEVSPENGGGSSDALDPRPSIDYATTITISSNKPKRGTTTTNTTTNFTTTTTQQFRYQRQRQPKRTPLPVRWIQVSHLSENAWGLLVVALLLLLFFFFFFFCCVRHDALPCHCCHKTKTPTNLVAVRDARNCSSSIGTRTQWRCVCVCIYAWRLSRQERTNKPAALYCIELHCPRCVALCCPLAFVCLLSSLLPVFLSCDPLDLD